MGTSFWDHPDWYDSHDNAAVAGPDREPEHYREFLIALPPIDTRDHVVDVGAGTGKLATMVAAAYPSVGRVTLLEPNQAKLDRARARLAARIGDRVTVGAVPIGEGRPPAVHDATLAIIGSVLMPVSVAHGGSLADARAWIQRALAETLVMLRPGGWLYDVETVAMPWDVGPSDETLRRLTLPELTAAIESAGFEHVECVFRFRDRVVVRASR
jgi:SAM-dependent methyltransferase